MRSWRRRLCPSLTSPHLPVPFTTLHVKPTTQNLCRQNSHLGTAAAGRVAGAAVLLVDGRPEQHVRQDGARRHRHQVAVVAAVNGLYERLQLLAIVVALVAKAVGGTDMWFRIIFAYRGRLFCQFVWGSRLCASWLSVYVGAPDIVVDIQHSMVCSVKHAPDDVACDVVLLQLLGDPHQILLRQHRSPSLTIMSVH